MKKAGLAEAPSLKKVRKVWQLAHARWRKVQKKSKQKNSKHAPAA